MVKDTVGIILGGGKGTRLFPLTLIRSKPAVPLGGKYRLIDIPISNCINSGINKVFVLTQYNSASLNRHINLTYRFGMFSQGFVDILAAEQTPESVKWYQGTADAVRQCLRHVLATNVPYILILSGDQLYRMDYSKVLKQHLANRADVTVCVIPVEESKASGFGILKLQNDGRITTFVEKPSSPKTIEDLKVDVEAWSSAGVSVQKPLLASMGIYLFQTEVLLSLLQDETKMDFGGQVIPSALGDYRVFGSIFDGYWEDIGTIRAFYEANLDLTSVQPKFNFYDVSAPIYTHPRFLPASRISDSHITQSIVSEGCFIQGARVDRSVIGIRSLVGSSVELSETMMMGADYYEMSQLRGPIPIGIGEGSVIRRAIIDKNARIGPGVRLENRKGLREYDSENVYIREGIIVVPKNAVLEAGTEI